MTIKFILDKFKEQDRRQLDLIEEIIEEKPYKIDPDVLFLEKFTWAILQQFNKEIKFKPKQEFTPIVDHNLPFAPRKINLLFKVPKAPSPMKLDLKLKPLKKIEI